MTKVFVSHTTIDTYLAQCTGRLLREHGLEVFLAHEEIAGGLSLESTIELALRESEVVFVLVTPTAIRSPWVWYEAGFAAALEKWIVPLTLHVDVADLPHFIQSRRHVALENLEQELRDYMSGDKFSKRKADS